MSGPPINTIAPLTKRLTSASRSFQKVQAARGARAGARDHRQRVGAGAERLHACASQAVSTNNIDTAQRASSAAAGALMLYQRARADQLTVMEPPAGK